MEFNDVSDLVGEVLWIGKEMYISKERKISSIKDTGIQYIYGHDDNFTDLVIKKYIPFKGNILDLGGGGLMFAIAIALREKSINVVDLDQDALDLITIVDRINKNGKFLIDINKIRPKIKVISDDIFNYLNQASKMYGLISAFRVIHFLDRDRIDKLFSFVSNRLNRHGIFAVSALTIYNHHNQNGLNEFYLNSSQVHAGDVLYRKFQNKEEFKHIRNAQNLPEYLHFIDANFIHSKAAAYGFEVIEHDIPSTRVTCGYILKKI